MSSGTTLDRFAGPALADLVASRTACVDHLEGARRHLDDVGWQKGLGPDRIEPSVSVEASGAEELIFRLRFPAPTRVGGQVEREILRRYPAEAASGPGAPVG
jgi:hypothetical protein